MRMLETLIFSKLSCVESKLCSQGLVSNILSLCVWGAGRLFSRTGEIATYGTVLIHWEKCLRHRKVVRMNGIGY